MVRSMCGPRVVAALLALTTFGGIGCASNPKNTSSPELGAEKADLPVRTVRHRHPRKCPAKAALPAEPTFRAAEPAATPVAETRPKPAIRVMGEVQKPGAIPFQKGADLSF